MGFSSRVPTTHIFPPQLTDTCNDGAGIIGSGFVSTVSSKCSCSQDASLASLLNSGIPSSIASDVFTKVNSLSGALGWVNGIIQSGTTMNVYTILNGLDVCGGVNGASPSLSVCKTVVSNHSNAQVQVIYKTDGTTIANY